MITYFKASASASSRESDALIITKRIPALYFLTKSIGASFGCCHRLTSEPCIRPPGPSWSIITVDEALEISGTDRTVISRIFE